MGEWNKELEKKILKKSRFTLTMRILRVFVLGMLVYGIYSILLSVVSDRFQFAEENDFNTKLALEWKTPNVRGTFDYTADGISFFGTTEVTYPIVKKVGKEDLVIGEAKAVKRLSDTNSYIEYQTPGKDQLNFFPFFYPEDPRTGDKLEANPEPDVWKTLDMLHEGIVGELAFSTDRFMEPEELIESLEPYDLDILWMQLHTGEYTEFSPGSSGGSATEVTVYDGIGLPPARTMAEDYLSSTMAFELDASSVEESKVAMLDNMEKLISDKSTDYLEFYLGLNNLQVRYDYLKENGFNVYGAVVTGPVKELLKLQDEEWVRGEQLGEVELWNWSEE